MTSSKLRHERVKLMKVRIIILITFKNDSCLQAIAQKEDINLEWSMDINLKLNVEDVEDEAISKISQDEKV